MMTYLLRVHDLYHQQSCLLGEPRFGQIAAIPMKTNGAPLIVDLFASA